MKFGAWAIVGIVLMSVTAAPATAQGVFDMSMLTNTLAMDHVTQSEAGRARGGKTGGVTPAPIPPKQDKSGAAYKVSQEVRQKNLAQFVAVMKKTDPTGAAQAEQLFAGGAIIDQIDQGIRPYGLRADNVADAYAAWWVTAWKAVNKQDVADTPALYDAVSKQAAGALMVTPAFVSSSDALKQEMAESMLIQTAMIEAYVDMAKDDATQKDALANAVNQGAKAMGLDLTQMNLTESGFSKR